MRPLFAAAATISNRTSPGASATRRSPSWWSASRRRPRHCRWYISSSWGTRRTGLARQRRRSAIAKRCASGAAMRFGWIQRRTQPTSAGRAKWPRRCAHSPAAVTTSTTSALRPKRGPIASGPPSERITIRLVDLKKDTTRQTSSVTTRISNRRCRGERGCSSCDTLRRPYSPCFHLSDSWRCLPARARAPHHTSGRCRPGAGSFAHRHPRPKRGSKPTTTPTPPACFRIR